MADTATPVAVTGVTGGLGGMVSRALADAGLPLRLLVRTPSKAPSVPGSSVAPFDYSDRNGCETALSGVHTLFFVSAAEDAHRLDQHRNVVEAAAAAGVQQEAGMVPQFGRQQVGVVGGGTGGGELGFWF